jgi:DNA-binding beta-propeller fold protein YncE
VALRRVGYVDLPAHETVGGFDHAAFHGRRRLLYVAHTANDAIDVIDCAAHTYLRSVAGLARVAGALVSEDDDLVFTSNRGENTVGIFSADREERLVKVKVGTGPNGLAYDGRRRLLLAANVGEASKPDSVTVSMVDVASSSLVVDVPVPGRTRWAVFDAESDAFYVNVAAPPQIVVIEAARPERVARAFPIPAVGPHGLDLDASTRRLFCACDGQVLVVLECGSGSVLAQTELSGVPDVIFFNRDRRHLYVAIGDPGRLEVFETDGMRRLETVRTEPGAHTLGLDPIEHIVYAFLPGSHRAAVYVDPG